MVDISNNYLLIVHLDESVEKRFAIWKIDDSQVNIFTLRLLFINIFDELTKLSQNLNDSIKWLELDLNERIKFNDGKIFFKYKINT